MTHPEYPVFRKVFLQWLFTERLVLLSNAEIFFKEICERTDFGLDEDNEKGFIFESPTICLLFV